MNAPLSAKQHREYLKFKAKEDREDFKLENEESRKAELHEMKLQQMAGEGGQKLDHKEDVHTAKMEELGSPLGKKAVAQPQQSAHPKPGPTDTVPAMLTPGEAVIPVAAAQNPANKNIIASLVNEGRGYEDGTKKVAEPNFFEKLLGSLKSDKPQMPTMGGASGVAQEALSGRRKQIDDALAGYAEGTTQVPNLGGAAGKAQEAIRTRQQKIDDAEKAALGYARGTVGVVQPANLLAVLPTVGPRRKRQGYEDGTTGVQGTPDFSRGRSDVVAGYSDGSIHIKESHEGLFTAKANAAGMGVQEYANKVLAAPEGHFDPSTRKQANFAKNAAGWEHGTAAVPVYTSGIPQIRGYANGTAGVNEWDNPAPQSAGIPVPQLADTNGWVTAPPSVTVQNRPLTIAERNQNPGNLIYAGQEGAVVGEPKRGGGNWAGFQDYASGRKALENQIVLDTQTRGMPLGQAINKYAPPNENDTTNYTSIVGKALGIGPADRVRPDQIPAFANAVMKHEGTYQNSDSAPTAPPQPADQSWLDKTLNYISGQGVPPVTAERQPDIGRGFGNNEGGAAIGVPHFIGADPVKFRKDIATRYNKPVPISELSPLVPAQVATQPVPNVEATGTKPIEQASSPIDTMTPEERDATIGHAAREKADMLQEFWKNGQPGNPPPANKEEKKSWFSDVVSSVFGPTGLFNDKELARFSILAAGGMATGVPIGNSIRYAAKNTLAASDLRTTAQNADARAQVAQQASEDRMIEKALIDQNFPPANIPAYMDAVKNQRTQATQPTQATGAVPPQDLSSILGKPTTRTVPTGKEDFVTFPEGHPLAGQQFKRTEVKATTGRLKDGMFYNINGVDADKFAAANGLPAGQSMVPWDKAQYGKDAIAKHYDNFVTHVAKNVDENMTNNFGSTGNRNSKPRTGMLSGLDVGTQAKDFFETHGYNPAMSPQVRTQMEIAVSNAHNKYIANKLANPKDAGNSIQPYLAAELVIGESGVPPEAFNIGATPMQTSAIAKLSDLLKNKTMDDSLKPGAKPIANSSELEQRKNAKIAALYNTFLNDKIAQQQYKGSKEQTAFYQYALYSVNKK